EKYTFYKFTDPNENAFTIQIPKEWTVSEDSGLIRPYIDAGIKLMAMSPDKNQQFIFLSPYAIYVTPNDLLTFSGFDEGSYYNSMLVKKYTKADDFLREIIQQLNIETEIIEVIERPDLINKNVTPLITAQSAAEITYISNPGKNPTINKFIAYNYLIDSSGMGIWVASVFGYSSPESLFNETEYLVLKSAETFKVDSAWAIREAQEVNKRLGIISSTQNSISETISSSFEYKSESQERMTNEWSKAILGVEEVYNSETGDTRFVDSGAEYYWQDNQGRIWGTNTDENPSPQEDMTKLEIKRG
ncbi:MAG TPA: hypothetical protein PK357_02260, partial [Candidatus Pacearchaeota archaeon]|nr:hypothetical protein [Candidatus Pacearchaeota archaeon]